MVTAAAEVIWVGAPGSWLKSIACSCAQLTTGGTAPAACSARATASVPVLAARPGADGDPASWKASISSPAMATIVAKKTGRIAGWFVPTGKGGLRIALLRAEGNPDTPQNDQARNTGLTPVDNRVNSLASDGQRACGGRSEDLRAVHCAKRVGEQFQA